MTLPASGSLSASQIQTEFGGSNPISLSEYYGRASGIPSSGAISFSQFRGKSALAFSPGPGSYSAQDAGGAFFTVTCTKTAVWTYTRTGSSVYNSTSPASGGSSTSLQTSQSMSSNNKPTNCTVTAYATVDGVQYGPWTIALSATDF